MGGISPLIAVCDGFSGELSEERVRVARGRGDDANKGDTDGEGGSDDNGEEGGEDRGDNDGGTKGAYLRGHPSVSSPPSQSRPASASTATFRKESIARPT